MNRFKLHASPFSVALVVFGLSGCTVVEVDRTTPLAWYYERYSPKRDQIVRLPSGPARVLVFEEVHFAELIYDKNGKDVGHWDGWRTEVEVFFQRGQLPTNSVETATNAAMKVCREFESFDVLEEHPHYVRFAADC